MSRAEMNWLEVSPGSRRLPPVRPRASSVSGRRSASGGSVRAPWARSASRSWASGLTGGSLRLPGDTSSQFISALLMAAPLGHAPLELTVDGLVSRPYVDMTLAMMAQFGVEAERRGHERFRVAPGVYLSLIHISEPTRLGMISYA